MPSLQSIATAGYRRFVLGATCSQHEFRASSDSEPCRDFIPAVSGRCQGRSGERGDCFRLRRLWITGPPWKDACDVSLHACYPCRQIRPGRSACEVGAIVQGRDAHSDVAVHRGGAGAIDFTGANGISPCRHHRPSCILDWCAGCALLIWFNWRCSSIVAGNGADFSSTSPINRFHPFAGAWLLEFNATNHRGWWRGDLAGRFDDAFHHLLCLGRIPLHVAGEFRLAAVASENIGPNRNTAIVIERGNAF